MPVVRSKADIMCLAVYTLAGGNLERDQSAGLNSC